MIDKPILQIFLSYRARYKDELQSLDTALRTHNGKYLMKLKASEYELGEGDSITGFMKELGAARFVVLMLTRDYFKSPYCLHELLLVHENCDTEKYPDPRFAPCAIRIDDSATWLSSNQVLEYLDEKYEIERSDGSVDKGYVGKRLQDLQREIHGKEFSLDELKHNVEQAFLDLCEAPVLNVVNCKKQGDDIINVLEQQANALFKEEEKQFQRELVGAMTKSFGRMSELQCADFSRILDSRRSPSDLAEKLFKLPVHDALICMQEWVEEQAGYASDSEGSWRRFFKEIELIAGWLILRGLRNDWWINNKLRMQKFSDKHSQFDLSEFGDPAFAEVVFSRHLFKAAEFDLYDGYEHDVRPKHINPIRNRLVYDASSGAMNETFLLDILDDLKGRRPLSDGKPSLDVLLAGLVRAVRGNRRKTLFYLVSVDAMNSLKETYIDKPKKQNLLAYLNEALGDKLVFVLYQKKTEQIQNTSQENEQELLARMADLLVTNKKRVESFKQSN